MTIYTSLEYLTFALIAHHLVSKKSAKIVILIISFLFIVFQVIYFFSAPFKRLDSIPIGVETILVLLFLTYLFYEQFHNTTGPYIYNNYWFWIVIGILTYLACSFFFNILSSTIERKSLAPYWFLTYIFETIKNIFFAIGILIFALQNQKNNQKQPSAPFLDMV